MLHTVTGAVQRKHYHFFTADGRFGSRDDDGTRSMTADAHRIGDDTLVIDDAAGRRMIATSSTSVRRTSIVRLKEKAGC